MTTESSAVTSARNTVTGAQTELQTAKNLRDAALTVLSHFQSNVESQIALLETLGIYSNASSYTDKWIDAQKTLSEAVNIGEEAVNANTTGVHNAKIALGDALEAEGLRREF